MDLRPFRPYIYRDAISRAVSPPFDTISPELAEELKKNPTNITHITLPGPGSEAPSKILSRWIEEGVIGRIEKDAFLGIIQEFRNAGSSLQRIGIIGLVNIFPDDGNVRPHEQTFERPILARMAIMEDLGAQPEPIFLLASSNRFEKSLTRAISESRQVFDFEQPIGVVNRVVLIDSDEHVTEISKALEGESAIVADGHHRLEATRRLAALHPNNPFWSMCMSYITSVHDSGLLISGIHRVVRKKVDLQEHRQEIEKYFKLEEVASFNGEESMVIFDGSSKYLRMVPREIPEAIRGKFRSNIVPYPYVLIEIFFKQCLGFGDEDLSDRVEYQHDIYQAIRSVEEGTASFVVIMPPWNKNTFIQMIMGGDLLPQKSTYFYPKIPSGIAIDLP